MMGKNWKSKEYWIGISTSKFEDRIVKWANKVLPDHGYIIKYYTLNSDDYGDSFISFTEEKYQNLFLLAFGDEI